MILKIEIKLVPNENLMIVMTWCKNSTGGYPWHLTKKFRSNYSNIYCAYNLMLYVITFLILKNQMNQKTMVR